MTPTTEKPQPPEQPRVAVVIVTRNQAQQLQLRLEALRDMPLVIVVDNGHDDTLDFEELFPHVRFIRLPRDFGMTKAFNLGIRAAEAHMVLFLSPDVEISSSAIHELADTLDGNPDIGAVCPLLNGAAQVSELPTSAQPHPPLRAAVAGESVPCATISAILFRSFFLRALRHIDERYGDYGSAIELCQQVKRANKTILIHPTAAAVLHENLTPLTAVQEADREIGTARFLRKHENFAAGTSYQVRRALAALFSFKIAKVTALVTQKKNRRQLRR